MTRRHLFLDDMRDPPSLDGEVVTCRTAAQALAAIDDGPGWETIWLDHHLGGGETGMVVVDALVDRADRRTPVEVDVVYAHSSDGQAADAMRLRLEAAGYRVVRRRV